MVMRRVLRTPTGFQTRWASRRATEPVETAWLRRFGMFAGGCVFPMAVIYMTRNERGKDIFQSDYEPKIEQAAKPSLGGPFVMTDCSTGRAVNEREVLDGHWTLLYFGFTKCAEVCPNTLTFVGTVIDGVEQQLQGEHPDDVGSLQCCFVSVDSVRDNDPSVVNTFLAKFRGGRRMRGLCGDDDQVARVCKAWRVYFSSMSETPEEEEQRKGRGVATLREAIAKDDTYQFDHSSAVYLVGPDGKLKDFFFREMGADHAVQRIGLHMADAYGINVDEETQLPVPKSI